MFFRLSFVHSFRFMNDFPICLLHFLFDPQFFFFSFVNFSSPVIFHLPCHPVAPVIQVIRVAPRSLGRQRSSQGSGERQGSDDDEELFRKTDPERKEPGANAH